MQNKLEALIPDTFYHIYNRANGSEQLFISEENYLFFLRKYKAYVSPICNTYCYCLMPNHFHFIIEIKSKQELELFFNQKTTNSKTLQGLKNNLNFDVNKDPQGFKNLEGLISQQFSNFFNSYVKSFNKQNKRKGSLLMHPFKRKKISDSKYLLNLVQYIHHNPTDAKLCLQLYEWKFSSYSSLISNTETQLSRNTVIEWFNDKANFEKAHRFSNIDFEIDY